MCKYANKSPISVQICLQFPKHHVGLTKAPSSNSKVYIPLIKGCPGLCRASHISDLINEKSLMQIYVNISNPKACSIFFIFLARCKYI